MTSSSINQEPTFGANPTTVDVSMNDLRSLTVALIEYLAHRKMLEERQSTFRAGVAAFIMSMGTSAAITNSWIAHSHGGKSRPVTHAMPETYANLLAVRDRRCLPQ